jgi:hypothetical protein
MPQAERAINILISHRLDDFLGICLAPLQKGYAVRFLLVNKTAFKLRRGHGQYPVCQSCLLSRILL